MQCSRCSCAASVKATFKAFRREEAKGKPVPVVVTIYQCRGCQNVDIEMQDGGE